MENKELIAAISSVPTIESYAQNLQQKLQMCKLLRESGFAPASYKNDGSVLAAILYGQELGFSPIQSLHSIDVIQGKPTVNAQGLKAMILAAGGLISEKEWTDKICTLEGYRNGHKQSASFTIQEAAQMGLTGKDNWRKMPKLMLYARAVSILARNQWADKIKGLYSKEEMQDSVVFQNIDAAPTVESKPVIVTADALIEEKGAEISDVLTFGKWKGMKWSEVNAQYLGWLVDQNISHSARARVELDRRAEIGMPDFNDINEQASEVA